MEQKKKIKEVFKDFKIYNSNILEAEIENVNLYNKTKKISIELCTETFIEIKDLIFFENYLKNRFKIENVWIDIKYYENTIIPTIEEHWKEILEFLFNKYPLTKAILKNCKLEIDDKNVNIIIPIKGAEILKTRGFDRLLEQIFSVIYKKTYKVNYIECLSEETCERYKKIAEQAEREAINTAKSNIIIENKSARRKYYKCKN